MPSDLPYSNNFELVSLVPRDAEFTLGPSPRVDIRLLGRHTVTVSTTYDGFAVASCPCGYAVSGSTHDQVADSFHKFYGRRASRKAKVIA